MLSPPSIEDCRLCGHQCGVNRLAGELGQCGLGAEVLVASSGPHYGEEPELVGTRGSGTIFFAGCNLHCLYCQNHEISQTATWASGQEVSDHRLAEMMLALQEQGCHNINLVSPSHVVAPVLAALVLAVPQGLRLPLVYNTGGYDSRVALRLLDGVIDIYMPDMKYADPDIAERLSGIRHYPRVNRSALLEMHRQVGDLALDERGIAMRGLLVRHLVLPGGLAGTNDIVRFLAEQISPRTYINIMDQYHPCYRAHGMPLLGRPVTAGEHAEATRLAGEAGLMRGF